jgi:fumarate reductase subunit C
MTYSEIYKIISFEKKKFNHNRIIIFIQNNLIIVSSSVEPKFLYTKTYFKTINVTCAIDASVNSLPN